MLSGIVLDSPDAQVLAAFYHRLLGWTVEQDEPGAPGGGPGLSFQTEVASSGQPGPLALVISK